MVIGYGNYRVLCSLQRRIKDWEYIICYGFCFHALSHHMNQILLRCHTQMVIRVLTQRSKKMADLTKRQSNISHICKNLLQWCLVDLFHHPIARQTPVSMQELELGIPQTTSHWLPVRFGPKRKILGANTMLQKSLKLNLSNPFF